MIRIPSILGIASSCLALLGAPHVDAAPGGNGKGGGKHGQHHKQDKKDKHNGKGKPGKPDKDDHGKGNKDKKDKPDQDRFTDDERDGLIRLFGGKNNPSEGQLPPGLAKNLERGKPLPPGWEKKLVAGNRIDNDFLPLLIPVSYDDIPRVRRVPGTKLYAHNDRLFLVRDLTHEIVDVILFR